MAKKKKKVDPCSEDECCLKFVFYCGAFKKESHWPCCRQVCRSHAKTLRPGLVVCPDHKDYTVEEYDKVAKELAQKG